MKVFKQTNLVRIFILAAMAVLVCPNAILAKPELDNPSFETGDLSGWNTVIPDSDYSWGGSIDVVEQFSSYEKIDGVYIDFDVYPKDGTGTYFAVLKPAYYTGFYTTLSQTFDAAEGDKISGWAFFDARDKPFSCNDYAYVRIIDSDGTVVTVFEASVSTVVPYGWTGWTKWEEYTCAEEGTYTIEAGVANHGKYHGVPSYLGLDSDVLTQEPKVLKQDIINQLGMYDYESKRIRKAIKHIQKSLDEDKKKKKEKNKLWEDDYHLTKKGKKVFNEEKKGAHELMKILKNDDVGPSVKSAAKEAIDFLVAADRALAQKAIDEATDASGDPKKIDKALKEMKKAQEEIDKEKYDKAIDHYKKAWEHAMKAMKKVVEDDPDEYL